jgi:hypothetical protein
MIAELADMLSTDGGVGFQSIPMEMKFQTMTEFRQLSNHCP